MSSLFANRLAYTTEVNVEDRRLVSIMNIINRENKINFHPQAHLPSSDCLQQEQNQLRQTEDLQTVSTLYMGI